MTRLEEAWALCLLTAFAPPAEQGLSPLPGEVDYLATLQRMRRLSTPLARFGLRVAIWLVALAPIWLEGRGRTISGLGSGECSALLSRLLGHHSFAVRELTLLLKLVASMALFASEGVRARSGYDNVQAPMLAESGLRRKLPARSALAEPAAISGEQASDPAQRAAS